MDLIVWNCDGGFRNKDVIQQYEADVQIIIECENPKKYSFENYEYTIWNGNSKSKGVGVFSNESLEVLEKPDRYNIIGFDCQGVKILGVWTKSSENGHYIEQLYKFLNESDIKYDVVCGDFNWNLSFSSDYALEGEFQDVLELLYSDGLYSCLHDDYGDAFGSESFNTFYMRKKSNLGYCVDYVFCNCDYREVLIGSYSEWIEYSDHMPIMVDLDIY